MRYVAIGNTTANAVAAQDDALARLREDAAGERVRLQEPDSTDADDVADAVRAVADALTNAQLRLLGTCATPDPAGVEAVLTQTSSVQETCCQ